MQGQQQADFYKMQMRQRIARHFWPCLSILFGVVVGFGPTLAPGVDAVKRPPLLLIAAASAQLRIKGRTSELNKAAIGGLFSLGEEPEASQESVNISFAVSTFLSAHPGRGRVVWGAAA
ncbi:hypothetical protein ZHAS_00004766 [Anopheles sinensis]|uniref:Uncharacterized protein n=1 Tax=Anopheles sinensis TaxID=74873 RepID=A0A084VHU2_ANOSI|nr:hypothetical protein ZHAS_00004766 [Anopheles sinensis]